MKKFNIWPYLLVFLGSYAALNLFFGGVPSETAIPTGEIVFKTVKTEYAIGKDIKVLIQNNTDSAIELNYPCIQSREGSLIKTPPFTVLKYDSQDFIEDNGLNHPSCQEDSFVQIESGKKSTLILSDFSYSYFSEPTRYKLTLSLPNAEDPETPTVLTTPEFTIVQPGYFTEAWRGLIYQPILNLLVAILIFLPGHPLWLGIVLLTLLIRTILLIPSQKGIQAQTRMQAIQPKLEELKKKHAGDQTRLAQETMMLWKTHKVSPFSSCLPMLVQMPILIALFYVVRAGLSADRSIFIYDFLPPFSLASINTHFLGFDLLTKSIIIAPIVIGGLQFLQMQLMMAKQNKNKKKGDEAKMQNEVETANKMMKYVMPVMIAVFAAQSPAAVSIYWGTSTFYGIVQQLVVNKKGFNSASPEDEVEVRVINRTHGKNH